jgi:HSP20 family protein
MKAKKGGNMANLIKPTTSWLSPFLRDFMDIDSFFTRDFGDKMMLPFPAVNISETPTSYEVEVAAPGFSKEDLSVKVEDDVLIISAETKEEKKEEEKSYTRREYTYNSFTRSFRLPNNVKEGEIKATYTDGMLKLAMPKVAEEVKRANEIAVV